MKKKTWANNINNLKLQVEVRQHLWLWLSLSFALLLRVWHIYNAAHSPTFLAPAVDPLWYHEAAQRVANGDFGPWPLFRAPLYPWLLGAVYALVDNDLLWARLLNLILQMATLTILYRVAQNYFGTLAARVAGILFAVNGMVIFYSAEILSTSLEMLMAVLVGWSTLALRKSLTTKQALICGLMWGLASITRPNFLLVAPVAIAISLWPIWKTTSLRFAITSFIGLALPIAPITFANWKLGYEPVLIVTQGGVNFWIGNNPQADGISSILPGADRFWTLDQAQAIAERESHRDLGPGGMSDFYYDKGKSFLAEQPGHGLKLMVRKALLFFNRFEVSNNKHIVYFAGQTPGLTLLILLNFALLLPLAVLAFWKTEARLLCGLVLTYAASVILFFIASRFRMPVVPWLCMLAGVGVTVWNSFTKPQKTKAGIVAIAVFILAIINPYNVRESNIGSAHYMEGNAYLALGNLNQARTSFKLAESDPGSRDLAMLNRAVVEQRANNLPEARTILLDMVKQNPRAVAAWNNLGSVLEQQQDTASALDAYHRGFNTDTSNVDIRANLSHLLLERGKRFLRDGDPVTAQIPLKECAAIAPSAQSFYHLAVAFGQNHQEAAARECLGRALHFQPDYEPALTLLRQIQASESLVPNLAPESK